VSTSSGVVFVGVSGSGGGGCRLLLDDMELVVGPP
jgi:hypothetical protein